MTYILVGILILFSGLFSGLNLGLMGLNTQDLRRKAKLGDKNAQKIYPLRKKGNALLVTLLLGNVAVNAVIAILLDSITSGLIAGITSTGLITIFGEIIPQATFARYALKLGAKFIWLVKIFIIIAYPFTKPISWTLDKLLGNELGTIYTKKELLEIIWEHKKSRDSEIRKEEEKIIRGALTFAEKAVKDIMTPRSVMVAFDQSQKINQNFLNVAIKSGLSRFPVYNEDFDKVVGILHLRNIFKASNQGKPLGDVAVMKPLLLDQNTDLVHAFNKLLKGQHHIALVNDEFDTILGVVTLEDIVEEIIGDEIVDESDLHVDMRKIAV
jgi:metal transporter CNNM